MTFILDSSVCLAWCFDDERTSALDALLDRLASHPAHVPPLWTYEVGNGLLMAQRRRRLSAEQREAILSALGTLDIRADEQSTTVCWPVTLRLADRYGLTVYDASYLELAQRLRLPLATLDTALEKAADDAGIPLMLSRS
jgi:predicted nucleic acid-binding protein